MPMHEPSCIEDPSFFVVSLFVVSWCRCPLTVFLVRCTHTVAQVWVSVHPIVIHACNVRCFWSPTSPFTSFPFSSSLLSPCCYCCPISSTSLMSWINPLRTSAEDFGTLAENNSSTGYEPNDHFIAEAYFEYTQESSGEQQIPDDFENDDVTIGQTLLHACRRRADHSEEEGLLSCLSSSVSHDRTVKPVVCRLVSSAQETQRHNSENEQIRILLERQREQILADCRAEIQKH